MLNRMLNKMSILEVRGSRSYEAGCFAHTPSISTWGTTRLFQQNTRHKKGLYIQL